MLQVRALQTVGEIAADQWGLVTTPQAEAVGVDRTTLTRLGATGLLDQVARGVHLVTAAGIPKNLDEKVAWLRLDATRRAWERRPMDDDSGVLSHRTACVLHELGDVPAPQVEITVPRRRTTRLPGVRLRRSALTEDEVTIVDGLPVTTVARTIIDLLADKVDGGHIGGVIADALRRELVDPDVLARQADSYARAYGQPDGTRLIDHLLNQTGQGNGRQVRAVAARLANLDPAALRALAEALEAVTGSTKAAYDV